MKVPVSMVLRGFVGLSCDVARDRRAKEGVGPAKGKCWNEMTAPDDICGIDEAEGLLLSVGRWHELHAM